MKRRWKIAIGAGCVLAATILIPMAYIEVGCRSPIAGFDPGAPYKPILRPAERRPEARTFLTYPEWHIVYSAESYGRHLTAAQRPSGYAFGGDIGGFWSSYCALNRATAGGDAGDAKMMIYTIGISYSVEMLVKAAYERLIGRFFEWTGGWQSADDRYAAAVQREYGQFMHETPWYMFPFGKAFSGEWRTADSKNRLRHVERRFALSAEYGVKAGYAKLIGSAAGATMDPAAPKLWFVAKGSPAVIQAIDPRLKPTRTAGGLTVVEAPRYAQFTDLLGKLAASPVEIVEISGNDDILVTTLAPDAAAPRAEDGTVLISQSLADRPGWRRYGISTKVPKLLALLRAVKARGGAVEHIYDY
ncbi:MAG: hypothetical protein WC729_10190 [Sphingomonas sp.]|jgi:hypothetical protein|uniref:hypothetical protein n=1 Tax=Sphingomonas sp. TaxID=28214 RepID=UPI0035699243